MSTHAGPDHATPPGICDWREDSYGVHLFCDEPVVPLEDLCSSHLIERAARRHFAARDAAHASNPHRWKDRQQ